eukprot:1154645-Pyramimonas_sp.AAC.1
MLQVAIYNCATKDQGPLTVKVECITKNITHNKKSEHCATLAEINVWTAKLWLPLSVAQLAGVVREERSPLPSIRRGPAHDVGSPFLRVLVQVAMVVGLVGVFVCAGERGEVPMGRRTPSTVHLPRASRE